VSIFSLTTLNVPSGTRVIVEGVLMALVLIVRPSGLTGGREFWLAWLRR
jgi:branched-chain amino acid transport system permease protein